jgi:hypothetical protein
MQEAGNRALEQGLTSAARRAGRHWGSGVISCGLSPQQGVSLLLRKDRESRFVIACGHVNSVCAANGLAFTRERAPKAADRCNGILASLDDANRSRIIARVHRCS